MRFIEEFVQKVRETEDSFNLTKEVVLDRDGVSTPQNFHFMQEKLGKVRYIFHANGVEEGFWFRMSLELDIVAILSKNVVYIVDEIFFNVWERTEPLPENVVRFKEVHKELQSKAVKVFPRFYESLDVRENMGEEELNRCKSMSRKLVLQCIKQDDSSIEGEWGMVETAMVICGEGSIEDENEILRVFEESRDLWIDRKTSHEKVKELTEDKSAVEDWELEIANSLRRIRANRVAVEFAYEGRKITAKIDPKDVIWKICLRIPFCGDDARSKTEQVKFAREIGPSGGIPAENIQKITFIGEILYNRDQVTIDRNT